MMSEFAAGAIRMGEAYGRDAAASAIFLFPQGDSAQEFRSDVALSNLSFLSWPNRSASSESASGHDDTGLVTIGDYLFLDGRMAHGRAAGVRQIASRASRAGLWTESVDALGIEVLEGGLRLDATRAKGPLSSPRDRSPGGMHPRTESPAGWEAKETE